MCAPRPVPPCAYRVVLCENGVAQALTQDHKPDIPAERDRIYQAGAWRRRRRACRAGVELGLWGEEGRRALCLDGMTT